MGNGLLRRLLRLCAAVVLPAIAAPAAAQDEQHAKTVSGIVVYLGVLPAEIVRGHPKDHPESTMHGGVPSNPRFRHLVVALFDSGTGERIADAIVNARVGEIGLSLSEKRLEPMTVAGAASFGNWFPMSGSGPYRIEVEIRRSGRADPVRAQFEYRHAAR